MTQSKLQYVYFKTLLCSIQLHELDVYFKTLLCSIQLHKLDALYTPFSFNVW